MNPGVNTTQMCALTSQPISARAQESRLLAVESLAKSQLRTHIAK